MNKMFTIKEKITYLIKEIDADFKGDFSQSLSQLNIDSFDFLSLRAELQESVGLIYSDEDWVHIAVVADFEKLGKSQFPSGQLSLRNTEIVNQERKYKINMPQMATGGLGESWYFKEIGDMHWRLLAKSLGLDTDKILDQAGDRLYATFVRIKYESVCAFQEFSENEEISLNLKMGRFGAFFSSENTLSSENKKICSQLVTSFVSRGKNNRDLKKSQPYGPTDPSMKIYSVRPKFLEEYYQVRKREVNEVELKGYRFKLDSKPIFEMDYHINPYTDLNGVNLLYFASYPLIFDFCERSYTQTLDLKEINGDWGIATSSVAKDIHYLGNADIHEALVFKLNTFEIVRAQVFSYATLFRKSDNELVAQVFSVKKIREIV